MCNPSLESVTAGVVCVEGPFLFLSDVPMGLEPTSSGEEERGGDGAGGGPQ